MTFTDKSTVGRRDAFSEHYTNERRGRWTGFNIAAMVVGFMLFWPVGLVVLYWILKGRDARDLPAAVREQWSQLRGVSYSRTDNVVFNEYQQTQYDRIREIKDEIDSRARNFAAFRDDAQRRKDEEEFSRFMASSPGQ